MSEVRVASVVRRLASRVRRGVSRRIKDAFGRGEGSRGAAPPPGTAAPRDPDPPTLVVRPIEEAPAAPIPEDTAGPPLLTYQQVADLFEDMVRPALQSDGGDITLVKVEQNDVYVELVGACHTCPSSILTMQNGIERLLREEFPHFGRLIRTDEAP